MCRLNDRVDVSAIYSTSLSVSIDVHFADRLICLNREKRRECRTSAAERTLAAPVSTRCCMITVGWYRPAGKCNNSTGPTRFRNPQRNEFITTKK